MPMKPHFLPVDPKKISHPLLFAVLVYISVFALISALAVGLGAHDRPGPEGPAPVPMAPSETG